MEDVPKGGVWAHPEEDESVNEWTHLLSQEEDAWCLEQAQAQMKSRRNSRAGSDDLQLKRLWLSWQGKLVASRCLKIGIITDRDRMESGHLDFSLFVKTTDFSTPRLYLNDRDKFYRAYILVRMNGKLGTCLGWMRFDEEAKAKGEFRLQPGNTGKPLQVWNFKVIDLNTMLGMSSRIEKLRQGI